MKKYISVLTALTLLIMVSSCNKKTETENKEQDNPLLQEWTTEYGVPPFDKIKTEHYIPAIKYYKMLFEQGSISTIGNTKNCGCHG